MNICKEEKEIRIKAVAGNIYEREGTMYIAGTFANDMYLFSLEDGNRWTDEPLLYLTGFKDVTDKVCMKVSE